MTRQIGWIDIEEERGFRITYRARLMNHDSESLGPITHDFSEVIDWFDRQCGIHVEVKMVGRTYRVFVEENETAIPSKVRNLSVILSNSI
jgi:hypothetical protein